MAQPINTSIQATGLSAPNLGATSFVRQAPVNTAGLVAGNVTGVALGVKASGIQSNAQAIGQLSRTINTATQIGLELHKQGAVAGLTEEMNAEIDATRITQEDPALVQATIGGIDMAQQSLFKSQQGVSSELPEAFSKEAKVLQQSYQQGAIDAAGLRLRLLNITRKHINNNPGLTRELLNHSETVLKVSGVSSLRDTQQKIDNTAAKLFETQRKALTQEFDKHNIQYDMFQTSDPNYLMEKQQELNSKRAKIVSFENFSEQDKIQDIGNKRDADLFVKKHLPTLIEGGVNSFHMRAKDILESLQGNPELIPAQIDALRQEYITNVNQQLAPLVNMASPEAKLGYDRFTDSINSAADRVLKASKGDNLLEALTNQNKIDSARNEAAMRNQFNLEAIDYMAKNEVFNRFVLQSPETVDGVLRGLAAMTFKRSNDPYISGLMTNSNSSNPRMKDGVAAMVGMLEGDSDRPAFSNALQVFSEATKNGRVDQQQVFDFIDNFVEHFSTPSVGALARKDADKSDIMSLGELTGQYVNYLGNAIKNHSLGQNVSTQEIEGVGVQFRVAGNPSLERELNHLYGSKINKLTKVFMNVGGMSHGEAWNTIRNSHGAAFGLQLQGTGRSNETNPGNIKNVGGEGFQSFASPQEGVKAIAKQIGLYVSGQSKNVSGATPIPMDFLKVYNNAKEKGSATDSQYANNVARFSGIDLTQPLDSGDMVDLVYGITKAENVNSKLTRKDIRLALQGGE